MTKSIYITEQDMVLFEETIGSLFLILDEDADIQFVSPQLAATSPTTTLEDLFPNISQRLIVKSHLQEALSNHRPIELEVECLCPEGLHQAYAGSFIPWRHQEEKTYVVLGLLEIKSPYQVESEFSSAFAKAINLVRDCVVIVDTEGKVKGLNASMVNLLDGETDDYLGHDFFSIIPLYNGSNSHTPVRPLENAFRHGSAVTVNDHVYLQSPNGPSLPVTVTARPYSRRDGQQNGAVIIIQRKRSASKGNDSHTPFPDRSLLSIAGLAHDLANSLTGAEGCLQLVDDHRSDKLRGALSAIQRAKDLAARLKEFSLDGKSIRTEISVVRLIEDSASILSINPHIQARTNIPWDVGAIHGDEVQLSRVLTNILKNAAEAMIGGGEITIDAHNHDTLGEPETGLSAGHYICLKISDTGPGIPAEIFPSLFESKFTTKPNGSGLGLPICKKIITDHNGAIKVESHEGKGSTFSLYLPRAVEVSEPSLFSPEFTQGMNQGRILVLDDDPLIRQILRDILTRGGYEVTVTDRSDYAIDAFMKAEAARKPYDLVIFDLTLNIGKDGAETFRTIRVIRPEIKGIISTGYHEDHNYLMNEIGFDSCVEKPYSADELLQAVRKVLTSSTENLTRETR